MPGGSQASGLRTARPMISDQDTLHCDLLYLLEEDPGMSQREIARRLGFSLGRTNYCLRGLVGKGWIKLSTFASSSHKSRYVYVLTPKGISYRAGMATAFLKRKRAEYEVLKAQIERLERDA